MKDLLLNLGYRSFHNLFQILCIYERFVVVFIYFKNFKKIFFKNFKKKKQRKITINGG
jgi:hypothetical protein